MSEETEALDWGNEEEEHQGAYRRASYDYAARRDSGDADDVEDTISLGEDEDDGYYYQREYTNRTVHSSVIAKEAHDRPPSVQQREESTGANDQPRSQHGYREPEHFEGATTQTSRLSASSPPRQRNSRNQSSPQHPNPTRLMHALPPKPIPAKVPYLPPSHPSIVAATSMTSISPRAASRDAKKVNGTTPGKPSSPAPPDLPQNWELRHPRRGGSPYYYNRETHESTWTLPTSRSNRDHDMEDATRPLPPDPKDLSYEDRHYRPGGDTTSVAIEVHAVTRSEAIGRHFPSRSRYDRSPSASPTRQRRRARSTSPPLDVRAAQVHARNQDYLPSRGNHHAPRERHGFTNPDPVLQRELDAMPPESGYTERWISPPTEFDQNERASRRQPRRPVDINDRGVDQPSSDDRTRPSLRRRESSQGPHRDRDREPPRHPDIREHSNGNPNFLSAPRPYPHERDPGRDYPGYREAIPTSVSAPSNRKERPPRFDRSSSANGPPANASPPDRDAFNSRPRDYDPRPPPNFDQRRGDERDYDRSRRGPMPEGTEMMRHPDNYPQTSRPMPERPNRYPDAYDRPSPEEMGQSSHRKRQPLPPQATTFLSSSTSSGPMYRDPPPHVPAAVPKEPKPPGWANSDPSLPRRPRFAPNAPNASNAKARPPMDRVPSRSVGTAGKDDDDQDNAPKQPDRGRNNYPQPLPKIDTRMEVDPRDPPKSRYPPSPRDTRSAHQHLDDMDDLPEGSRSSRPVQTAPQGQAYSTRATSSPTEPLQKGPENARYDNASSAGLPPRPDEKRNNDDYRDSRSGWGDSRPGNMHPERIPPQPRRDFRVRPDDRPPPQLPVSGTNNVPIGTRRTPVPSNNGPPPTMSNGPSAPPTVAFNPDARPPPSTLINAAKARELPSGKESYERPLNPPVPDEQRSATLSEGYRYPTPPQHLNVPTETEKPKSRRPTRFSPLAPKKNLEQDHPVLLQDRVATQDHPTTTSPKEPSQGHATPPPMSREPSMLSLTDHLSAQRSDRGQSSDGRSDGSRAGPRVRYMDQREDLPVPSRLPDDRPPSATSGTQPRRKDPLSTSSAPHTEATAFHRPRPSKWSEQMSIAGAAPGEHSSEDAATADLDDLPSLSRRLSSEKPPRHRKYSGGFIAPDGKFPTDSVSHSLPTPAGSGRESQDDTLSFKDRLEKPNTQRRGQQIPLLDRLSSAGDSSRVNVQDVQQQSLRERLIPSKRDREDMMMDEGDPRDLSYDGEDGNESKRARRRNPKGKRGGRR